MNGDNSLSILIPVYNQNVFYLVKQLSDGIHHLQINYEILVFDDASHDSFKTENRQIRNIGNCVFYKEFQKNLGRAAMRNKLARAASCGSLLFLDCDGILPDKVSFFENLKPYIGTEKVVVGGRVYAKEPPQNTDFFLHWFIGKKKEEIPASKKKEDPYGSFLIDNMLIPKNIFLDIMLDEKISQYGHEDTKFGEILKRRNITVTYIDNPVEHIGLNSFHNYLEKTYMAIDNLYKLFVDEGIGKDTRIIKTFLFLRKYKLHYTVYFILNLLKKYMENRLKKRPSGFIYDLIKLRRLLGNYCRKS